MVIQKVTLPRVAGLAQSPSRLYLYRALFGLSLSHAL